MNYTGLRGI